MGTNDLRAAHRVSEMFEGYCVKWMYKDFEISLACDGSNTSIFEDEHGSALATFNGTNIESIMNAKDFIDKLTS